METNSNHAFLCYFDNLRDIEINMYCIDRTEYDATQKERKPWERSISSKYYFLHHHKHFDSKMSRSPQHVTAILVLRGALLQTLNIPCAKTVIAAKTENGSESLTVKHTPLPSLDDIKGVIECANRLVSNEEKISSVDVKLPITLINGATWADSEFACEYAKFKPKETDKFVRFTSIDQVGLSAIPHDGSMPSLALENTGGCGKLVFKNYSANDKRGEFTIEFQLQPTEIMNLAEIKQLDTFPEEDLRRCIVKYSNESDVISEDNENQGDGQVVTPWTVSGSDEKGVDYNKLIETFGCEFIDQSLLDFFHQVTGHQPHPWLRRGIFFSHRDLKEALVAKQKGKPLYLYTGRGPSSESLHFGHLIPFMFTAWLQKVFDCPLVIQLTDDEKFLFQKDSNNPKPLEEFTRLGYENARDIMAVGFDPKKTFIFLNTEYIGHMYPLVVEIQKNVTFNQARGIFGFHGSTSTGQIAFPAIQAAPSFSECFPTVLGGSKKMTCLIPCAIDQDPYFRMTRDVARKIGLKKPALIHAKFFPALQGANSKMSGSVSNSAVMVTDDEETIRKKISSAFSGGRSGPGQQEQLGADLSVDIAYQWLRFFLLDDKELQRIEHLYGPGELVPGEQRMFTIEVKTILSNIIIKMAKEHQERKKAITQEVMDQVFSIRRIIT